MTLEFYLLKTVRYMPEIMVFEGGFSAKPCNPVAYVGY